MDYVKIQLIIVADKNKKHRKEKPSVKHRLGTFTDPSKILKLNLTFY